MKSSFDLKPEFNNEEVLAALSKKSDTHSQLDVEFLVDELSSKLTLRQSIILRLKIFDGKSQVEISRLLGFSTPTISLEMKKIKTIIKKFYAHQTKMEHRQ